MSRAVALICGQAHFNVVKPHLSRPLTDGELALARSVFGEAIDYARVRLHRARRYFFQPANCAMAPDGHVWFPPACWRDDFSTDVGHAAWLIHELTHVWQHQQGMWVRLRGCFERRYRYGDLTKGKPFRRYGIEQQAAIVEDYFRQRQSVTTRYGHGTASAYQRLSPFGQNDQPAVTAK